MKEFTPPLSQEHYVRALIAGNEKLVADSWTVLLAYEHEEGKPTYDWAHHRDLELYRDGG